MLLLLAFFHISAPWFLVVGSLKLILVRDTYTYRITIFIYIQFSLQIYTWYFIYSSYFRCKWNPLISIYIKYYTLAVYNFPCTYLFSCYLSLCGHNITMVIDPLYQTISQYFFLSLQMLKNFTSLPGRQLSPDNSSYTCLTVTLTVYCFWTQQPAKDVLIPSYVI